MLMESLSKSNARIQEAREYDDKGYSFTRRTIAISAVASIVVLPVLAAILFPGLPISYGFTESWSSLFGGGEGVIWTSGTGIVITPMHSHLVYAIAGMYFGGSSVKA